MWLRYLFARSSGDHALLGSGQMLRGARSDVHPRVIEEKTRLCYSEGGLDFVVRPNDGQNEIQ